MNHHQTQSAPSGGCAQPSKINTATRNVSWATECKEPSPNIWGSADRATAAPPPPSTLMTLSSQASGQRSKIFLSGLILESCCCWGWGVLRWPGDQNSLDLLKSDLNPALLPPHLGQQVSCKMGLSMWLLKHLQVPIAHTFPRRRAGSLSRTAWSS